MTCYCIPFSVDVGWWVVQSSVNDADIRIRGVQWVVDCTVQCVQCTTSDCEMASISLTIQSQTCGPTEALGRF